MQRLLATACAVTLAMTVPAIELKDTTSVDATETAARPGSSAPQEQDTPAELHLASWTASDADDLRASSPPVAEDAVADDIRPVVLRSVVEPLPQPNVSAPPFTADELPSLAGLDEAFDVPVVPTLVALDAAFDNRPIKLPPVPLPWRRPPTVAEVCDTLASAATAHDLPTPFLIRLIWQESRFHHNVVSHAGAQGIAQFMPATASGMGLGDPFNPLEALPQSARLLRSLIERFGNIGLAAAAYNAGPKRVLDWLARKGRLPEETQHYVKTITGQPAEQWRKRESTGSLPRVPERAPCQREAGLHAADGPERVPLPPDAPGKTPNKVLVAASDKKPTAAARSVDEKATETMTPATKSAKRPAKAIQLAAMRNVKSKTKAKSAQKKADAKSVSKTVSAKARAGTEDAPKAPKKIAAASKP